MADIKTSGGGEYILRADLNSLGRLQARYGTLGDAVGRLETVEELLRIAAELINEHYYAVGLPDRITPAALGAQMSGRDIMPLTLAVLEALNESVGGLKKKTPRKTRKNTRIKSRSGS